MSNRYPSTFITRSSRELGLKPQIGDNANLQRSLASNIKVHHTWQPRNSIKDSDHGGVFNFDFSKNGSLLGVACERKSVLLFDPFNGQLVAAKTNAHTDCVNCVKFLDDRLFATCSDDTNVALWDARYLKHHVQVFHGHSNWVKNIEYDSNQGMLLTSGFDGCIYTWNINKYSNEESSNKVFSTSGLMRSKLSPDFTKLLISTHEGYIIVIHNLDLTTIGEDLKGFKPNMYHLMQRSQTPLRIGLIYNHVFEQERNRVEFINDWPAGNDANIVSSIQVHPQGWCVLSRNTDSSEKAEWTCVHDIQDYHTEKKPAPHPWELEGVTPHTSAAHSKSTNTPAFSSVAPSHLRGTTRHNNENIQNNSSNQLRSSSMSAPNTQNQSARDGSINRQVQGTALNSQSNAGNQQSVQEGNQQSIQEGNQQSTGEPTENNEREPTTHEVGPNSEDQISTQEPTNNEGQETSQESTGPAQGTSNDVVQSTSQGDGNQSNNRVEENLSQNRLEGAPQGTSTGAPQGLNNLYIRPEVSGQDNMQVHDSLIQIRRGARNSDGQFSFSISVHTASGRTIEFNQDDLDSSDDDEFVVEQIVRESNESGSQNITIVRQQDSGGNTRSPRGNSSSRGRDRDEYRNMSNRLEDLESESDEDYVGNLDQSDAGDSDNYDNVYQSDQDDDYMNEISNDGEDQLGDNFDDNLYQSDNEDDVSERDNDSNNGNHDNDEIRNRQGNTSGAATADNEAVQDDISVDQGEGSARASPTGDRIIRNRINREAVEDDDDVFEPFEEYAPFSDDSEDESNEGEGNHRYRNLIRQELFERVVEHGSNLDDFRRNIRTVREDFRSARHNILSRNSNTRQSAGTNPRDSETNEEHADDESGASGSSRSAANENQASNQNNGVPTFSSAASAQPRTNTLMFVVHSNSGDRRRRYFNLSYMDSYTERENSVLQKKIHSNRKRLLGYMEECNVGRGFIKEVAFSADGRLISSPFGFGLRIFGFDSDCNELCDCIPRSPVKLYEVTCSLAHVNCVVATKFSPTHNLVVSGCLDGKIAFHQPIL